MSTQEQLTVFELAEQEFKGEILKSVPDAKVFVISVQFASVKRATVAIGDFEVSLAFIDSSGQWRADALGAVEVHPSGRLRHKRYRMTAPLHDIIRGVDSLSRSNRWPSDVPVPIGISFSYV